MPAPITLAGFAGSNLALDAHALSPTAGVDAVDIEPGRDHFVPLRARVTRATVPTIAQRLSIHRTGRDVINAALYWLSSSLVVTYARMFGKDATERTIIAGDGTPKWTNNVIGLGAAPYPQATRELSVPAPIAPTATQSVAGVGTDAERYYVQTFVNDLGWESGPSPPSTVLVCKPGAIIDLTALGAPPAGSYGFTARRLYRTQPGVGSNTDFYFLREVTSATTTTQDDARALGALLATYDGTAGSSWLPPPSTGFGILALWNGMHAMLSAGLLHLCVPNAPYAWPSKHDKALKSAGVALGKWGQNLAVLTTGEPVVYAGTDPLGMTALPAALNHPCLSARGVVSFAYGVAWPSNDGLAWIGDSGQAILTDGVLTPEQWRALVPTTMKAGRWREFYVCAFNDGTSRGFMLDPKRPGVIHWLSTGFDACHYDEIAQALFVLEGGNVREFSAGSALTGSFTSKRFLQTHPVNYGWAKVIAASYPVTVSVTSRWHDAAGTAQSVTDVRVVPGPDAYSLLSGFLAESIQIRIDAAVDVTSVRLASHPRDLKGL